MNLNPVASGNKTQSGIGGLVSLALGGAVMAVLKNMGIDDTTGAISGAVTSAAVSGCLFVWGLIHKVIKGDQVDPSPALDARRQHLQEAAGEHPVGLIRTDGPGWNVDRPYTETAGERAGEDGMTWQIDASSIPQTYPSAFPEGLYFSATP